jgi:guanosine-3',5'-bis(diphosphate) 3'-pyrophosphohydrolase
MLDKRLSFSQVLDVYGFRVSCATCPPPISRSGHCTGCTSRCRASSRTTSPIPKPNGYQSLHTTLIGPHGTPFELQIRTEAMENVAQEGIASHWLYKDSEHFGVDLQQKTTKWFHSLLDLQSANSESSEFFEHVKVDLFPHEIYVFTPKGKIIALPRGATAVDLAYAVHTDIGNHCVAAHINFKPMPLITELTNGDRVEIMTAADAHPSLDWLASVKTGRARSKIRHYLKSRAARRVDGARREDAQSGVAGAGRGRFRTAGLELEERPARFGQQADQGSVHRHRSRFSHGRRRRSPPAGARGRAAVTDRPPASLVIRGTEGMAVQFAPCCQPIPGDPIVGSIWKGKGLVIHTHDCPAIRKARSAKPTKWIDVEWEPEPGKLFSVRLLIMVQNTVGALGRIATEISSSGTNIEHVNMDEKRPGLLHDAAFHGPGGQSHRAGAPDAQRSPHSGGGPHFPRSGADCLKVVVVGAGVVGVTSAWYLAGQGIR